MTASDSPESNSDDAAVGDGQRAHDSGGQNSETKNQTVESGHRISAGNRSADGGHVGREVKFKRPPNRIRRATIAACFAVILAGYLQWNATATDHQFSNITTVTVFMMYGKYYFVPVFVELFRTFQSVGTEIHEVSKVEVANCLGLCVT